MYIGCMGKLNHPGCFKKGRTETSEQKSYRIKRFKDAWPTRSDYHGMYYTKFYNSWRSMVTRCRGTAGEASKRKYLNRGIKVCEKWQKFQGFYEDMFADYR